MTAAKTHAAKGHAKKHATAKKHVHKATKKHNPPHQKPAHHVVKKHTVKTVGKHKAAAKGLAPALGDVACCTAEALAASLRLTGAPVSDADVLDLFRRAGGDPDGGAPVLAALSAAAAGGLAGRRACYEPVPVTWRIFTASAPPLLLGADLPGQHAVWATPQGWWSWGELYCPWCEWPDLVVDEAWAVSWQ